MSTAACPIPAPPVITGGDFDDELTEPSAAYRVWRWLMYGDDDLDVINRMVAWAEQPAPRVPWRTRTEA